MNLSSNFNRLSFSKLPLLKQPQTTEAKAKEEPVVVQKQQAEVPTTATITASALDAEALQNMNFISTAATVESKAAKKTGHLTEAEAKEQGYVTISTAEELINLVGTGSTRCGSKFILMNDIDMSAFKNFPGLLLSDSEFNGNGYTIKNLSGAHGLFSNVNGDSTIKNVNIDNANIKATEMGSVGVLADRINGNVIIDGCNITNSTIDINDQSIHAGFLVGVVQDETNKIVSEISINNCHVSSSNIIGGGRCTPEVGGLVGESSVEQLNLVNSSFQGGIEATGRFVGNLVGRATGNITETGCFSEVNKPEEMQYKFPDLIDMKQDEKDMKDAAYKQGLTESPCSGVYSKQVRSGNGYKTVYYIWNSNDKEFERCNDIKSINADGSYVNNRGKTINKPANEQIAARVGGYTPTVEEGTYFKDGKYYNYDEDSNEFFEVDKSLYEVHDKDTTKTEGTKTDDANTDKKGGVTGFKIPMDFKAIWTLQHTEIKVPFTYPLYKRFEQ